MDQYPDDVKATVTHHVMKSGVESLQHHTLGYSARLDTPAEAARLAGLLSGRPDDWYDVRHPYRDDPCVVWFQERSRPEPERPPRRFATVGLISWVAFLALAPGAAVLIGTVGGHPGVFEGFLGVSGVAVVAAVVPVFVRPDERRLMQRRIDLLTGETPGAGG